MPEIYCQLLKRTCLNKACPGQCGTWEGEKDLPCEPGKPVLAEQILRALNEFLKKNERGDWPKEVYPVELVYGNDRRMWTSVSARQNTPSYPYDTAHARFITCRGQVESGIARYTIDIP